MFPDQHLIIYYEQLRNVCHEKNINLNPTISIEYYSNISNNFILKGPYNKTAEF